MSYLLLLILPFLLFNQNSSGLDTFPTYSSADYNPLVTHIGAKSLVLLGEASHGTSEFYSHRARITKKLIASGNYAFVAVEGDWSLFTGLNAWVKHLPEAPASLEDAMSLLTRWPHWMWRNHEFRELVDWLHEFNRDLPYNERVGLYGIDLYAKHEGMNNVISWISANYPDYAQDVYSAYRCLARYTDIRIYLQRVASTGDHCGNEGSYVLELLERLAHETSSETKYPYLHAELNALMVQQAEIHYRGNLVQGPASWNTRASFFYSVTERMLGYYNQNSDTEQRGGIVWAHNTHIGDARATDMSNAGMVNIGQLARENLGVQHVFSVGFGTYEGEVLAASAWEGAIERMPVRAARSDSWEHMLASLRDDDFFLIFGETYPDSSGYTQNASRSDQSPTSADHNSASTDQNASPPGRSPIPHRAIGVTFNPNMADRQNYPISIPAERYNAFVFIRTTTVLLPLDD